jgi:ureidoacrylate peracid hydrolase
VVSAVPVPVPAERTALLLVDVQNAFLDPAGMVARMAGGSLDATYTATIEPVRRTIAAARAHGTPVVYTQHQLRPDLGDAGFLGEEILPKLYPAELAAEAAKLVTGSWEAEILPALAPQPGDHVVPKNRYDAFLGTTLEQLLNRLGVTSLVVAGLVTTVCVESTVRAASMRDYRVFLVGDAIGDAEANHAEGLRRLGAMFGHLVSADDVEAAWGAQVPVAA